MTKTEVINMLNEIKQKISEILNIANNNRNNQLFAVVSSKVEDVNLIIEYLLSQIQSYQSNKTNKIVVKKQQQIKQKNTNTNKLIHIKALKYNSKCNKCNVKLVAGYGAYYDKNTKKLYCSKCK